MNTQTVQSKIIQTRQKIIFYVKHKCSNEDFHIYLCLNKYSAPENAIAITTTTINRGDFSILDT